MAGPTVTVACKHPPGILMRVFHELDQDVPVLGGGTRTEKRSFPIGEPIKINGPAVPFGQAPAFVIAGGYALTPNVPADVAAKWMEQNKDSALVRNNLIHIHEKPEFAEKKAKEQKEVRSGLERLDVTTVFKQGRPVQKDPRWPARTNANLSSISTDQRDNVA